MSVEGRVDYIEEGQMHLATIGGEGAMALLHSAPQGRVSLGDLREYEPDDAIYGQREIAEHWYLIVSGAARKCAQISDGRRQIMDFLLPGDLIGFETAARRECAVECVATKTTVVRYQRQRMELLMEADPQLARQVREIAFSSIDRLQSRMILLGCSRALERVCGFLLEMVHRVEPGIGDQSPYRCLARTSPITSRSPWKR
jgi:CRP-like cAMP-binding protein